MPEPGLGAPTMARRRGQRAVTGRTKRGGGSSSRGSSRRPKRAGFVGRDPSPVKDSYPEKAARAPPAPPPLTAPSSVGRPPSAPPASASRPEPAAGAASPPPPEGLIRLERPFDPDDVSRMLGETSIRLTVPPDALPEVLRRVTEFMGFGIYVYAISVRPAPSEMLRGFVVELQRVDFDPESGDWRPFVERGVVGTGADAPP